MLRAARPTLLSGPALAGLLGEINGSEVPASGGTFAGRLGRWLGWRHAIALSAALGTAPAGGEPIAGAQAGAEVQRLKDRLARAIEHDALWGAPRPAPPADAADFSPYRRRYQAHQQAMEAGIAALRRTLREALAAHGGPAASLAAVDAVMEQALGEKEQAVLAAVAGMLEPHFQRLREAGDEGAAAFRRDLQAVLLAELELRLQPAEGLAQALRAA